MEKTGIDNGQKESTFDIRKYSICSVDSNSYWDKETEIMVELEEIESEKIIEVNALKYGGLYQIVNDTEDISDNGDDSIKSQVIVGVVKDNEVYAFGLAGSDRIEETIHLLKSTDIQRKR